MDGDSWLSWLLIAALLAVAAFFALAETAVTSVSRIRLKTRADRGERSAEKALFVLDHFDEAISAMLRIRIALDALVSWFFQMIFTRDFIAAL